MLAEAGLEEVPVDVVRDVPGTLTNTDRRDARLGAPGKRSAEGFTNQLCLRDADNRRPVRKRKVELRLEIDACFLHPT